MSYKSVLPSAVGLGIALLALLASGLRVQGARAASQQHRAFGNNALVGHSSQGQVLSRRRRFIAPASSGYSIGISFSTYIPFPDLSTGLSVAMPFRYYFDNGIVTGRSFSGSDGFSRILDRFKVFSFLEEFLGKALSVGEEPAMGGKSCMLRSICEVALVPDHDDSLLHEAMNLLLVPGSDLPQLPEMLQSSDYVRAQRDGAIHEDCSQYEKHCKYSLFEMISLNENSSPIDMLKNFAARNSPGQDRLR